MSAQQHTLYRFYSDTGQLLYVGRTINPAQRFTDHARTKPSWPDVRGITVQDYPDHDTLAAAERRAISVEQPLHNIQRPTLQPPTSRNTTIRALTWICDACELPVTNGAGYLHINLVDAAKAQQADAAIDHSQGHLSIEEILAIPTVRWVTHHRTCDPDIGSLDYCIDVAKISSHADLLRRSAHLQGKRWIEVTDWWDLIARIAEVDQ